MCTRLVAAVNVRLPALQVLLVLNKVTTIIPGSNSVPLRAVAATTTTPPLHVLNFVASSSATAGHSNLAKKEKEKKKTACIATFKRVKSVSALILLQCFCVLPPMTNPHHVCCSLLQCNPAGCSYHCMRLRLSGVSNNMCGTVLQREVAGRSTSLLQVFL